MRPSSVSRARRLRRRMTDAEQRLWWRLRDRQLVAAKLRRQEPIGSYFVDFCCVEHKLIVELDGGQHDEPAQREYDRTRTEYLMKCGYRVLRFWNTDVFGELEGVLETIAAETIESPHPVPLPAGEGTLHAAPGRRGSLSRRERDRVRG